MNLKDALKVKTTANLKMGTKRVSAGETFDVSQDMPQWIRKEFEAGLGTVVVTDWKQPTPKKMEKTEDSEDTEEKPTPKKKSTKGTVKIKSTKSTSGKKSTKKKTDSAE